MHYDPFAKSLFICKLLSAGSARNQRHLAIDSACCIFLSVLFMFAPRNTLAGEHTYTFSLKESSVVVVEASSRSEIEVHAGGYYQLQEEGKPALPYSVVNVLLLQGEEVEDFRFVSAGKKSLRDKIRVQPASSKSINHDARGHAEPPFWRDKTSSAYPPVVGTYLGTGYLHGYAIASFAVYPLQYSEETLFLNEEINLHLLTRTVDRTATIVSIKRLRVTLEKERRNMIAALVVNPGLVDTYDFNQVHIPGPPGGFQPTEAPALEGSPVDYVIITDQVMAQEYQRLADWKTRKGIPTVVKTVEWIEANCRNGVDLPETIRYFVREAYEKWGVQWILLGGDTNVIPARYAYSRHLGAGTFIPADLYFACLDGSWNDTHDRYWGEGYYNGPRDNPDLYAEVYVGRLPSSTVSEASTLIDKIISYELPLDRSFTDKVLLLAEVLFPPNWHEGEPISFNGADLSESLYVNVFGDKPLRTTRSYESYMLYDGAVPLYKQATIDSMNSGANIINHVGHGSRFNISCGNASLVSMEADDLFNQDRLFMLYMVDCSVSAFDYSCLAEYFMKNPRGGAVATIGASHLEFPYLDNYLMNDFYDLVFNQNVVRIGEAFARSRLYLTPFAETGDNAHLWTTYVYTLLSDPELPLWTDLVDTVVVVHPAGVAMGTDTIEVNVMANSQPVDSAIVCLSKGSEDYQYAATDATGDASFIFTTETPGSIGVVVTGINLARHESHIAVEPAESAFIHFWDLTVDDDTTGYTYGNYNGIIDAGETIDVIFELVNTGGTTSGAISLVVRSDDSLATVLDSTAVVGVIDPQMMKSALDPVRIEFTREIPDQAVVSFEILIADDAAGSWHDRIDRIVHAPLLDATVLRIDDAPPLGNGNGVNEPGEEFILFYGIKNFGSGAACGLSARLEDLDSAFLFIDSTDIYPDLDPFADEENIAGFHMIEWDTGGDHFLEVIVSDLFGHMVRDTVELRIPQPPSVLYLDASHGADRVALAWQKSPTADVTRYRIYNAGQSGGSYNLVSVDPVEHTVFMNTGLLPNTRYYYVVTSIDGSGNESNPSPEFSITTNPPQLIGWPTELAEWTMCSPVVGDLNGDGDLEVVAASDHIYAWHHDGQEIRDGDGNAETQGIFTTEGENFTAPVSLVNMDNSPGLDIVAADLNTKKLYCFDFDGELIAGWPQQGEHDFRAAPVAGDLNGDGFPELIAVDSHGVVYAWYRNGTEYRDGDGDPATYGVFYRTPEVIYHFQTPTLCDIDGDHRDEIVLGTRCDSVYVLNENDSTTVAGWPIGLDNEIAGSIAAGDMDNDGLLELLAQTKGQFGKVYVLNHDATIADGWPRTIALTEVFFTPSPALADFDGDGTLEAIVYSWNGNESKLYIMDHQGNDYPGWPVVVSYVYSESSPVVADVNGDGSLDVVFGDEERFIRAFDVTGNVIDGFPAGAGDAIRATPVLTDLDQDGDIEMVVAGWDRHVHVWDLTGAFDENLAPWPMFHANAYRNGLYGFEVITAVTERPANGAAGIPQLMQNYPNPFNPSTTILFDIPAGSRLLVTLNIYSVTGALVKTLVDRELEPGRYRLLWDGTNNSGLPVGSGLYFYRLKTGEFVSAKKMLLLQ